MGIFFPLLPMKNLSQKRENATQSVLDKWDLMMPVLQPSVPLVLSPKQIILHERLGCDRETFQSRMLALGDAALWEGNMHPTCEFYLAGDCMDRLVRAGDLWLAEGDINAARTAYELSGQNVPSEKWTAIGNAYLRQERIIDAENAYKRAGNIPEDIVRSEADRMLQKAMEMKPIDVHTLSWAYACLRIIQAKFTDETLSLIADRLLREHDMSSEKFLERMQSIGGKIDRDQVQCFTEELMQQGKFCKAKDWLKAINEDLPSARLPALGEEYIANENIEMASSVYESLGNKEKCVACFHKMLQRPWDKVHWDWLIRTAERMNIDLNADPLFVAFAQTTFEAYPDRTHIYATGSSLVIREWYGIAGWWLNVMKFLARFPAIRTAWENLGDSYTQSQRFSEAIDAYSWAKATAKMEALSSKK